MVGLGLVVQTDFLGVRHRVVVARLYQGLYDAMNW